MKPTQENLGNVRTAVFAVVGVLILIAYFITH